MYEVKISVVIVSYNVKHFLRQCLCSVQAALSGLEGEVFVVDNHSTDGSVDDLRPEFPWVTFMENAENMGFARANNVAIRQCRGEYVLLLNPDTVIGEESLRTLCFFMDERREAGAAGVKMLNGNGAFLPESKRSFPTPWVSFCKLSGLSGLFPRSKVFARYSLLYKSADKRHRVDVLSGAFMFLRREALDKAGLLDESFFMYGEDVDLSYRLALSGYRNYYLPERILHYKGESTPRGDARYIRAFYGAMLVFCRKYYPRTGVLIRGLIRALAGLKAGAARFRRPDRKAGEKKRRRLLVLCRGERFEAVKAACLRQIPGLEGVHLWNLDDERAMDAACRRNRMKGFTDYAFAYPDMRFEQMFLLMDKEGDAKMVYHIYHAGSGRLISPGQG
jgi:GT2 family glycosyltransferase